MEGRIEFFSKKKLTPQGEDDPFSWGITLKKGKDDA